MILYVSLLASCFLIYDATFTSRIHIKYLPRPDVSLTPPRNLSRYPYIFQDSMSETCPGRNHSKYIVLFFVVQRRLEVLACVPRDKKAILYLSCLHLASCGIEKRQKMIEATIFDFKENRACLTSGAERSKPSPEDVTSHNTAAASLS